MAKSKKTEDTSLKDFLDALDDIQRAKGIDKDKLISVVEDALLSAYKKDYKGGQNARIEIDRETGALRIFAQRRVVEGSTENIYSEISLEDAKKINPGLNTDDVVEDELDPKGFGRVAAQNAKQTILQRIKKEEQELIFETFFEKKDELLTGTITRIDKNDVHVEVGKYEGVINSTNQISSEQYYQGMKIKVYVVDVVKTNKGPQIVLSRSHSMLIKRLFELEIPEIYDGLVEITSIAREAGSRTKLAVQSRDKEIDAVGACVGHKGTRIQNILNELGSERIDVVEFDQDMVKFIKNALSPAEVIEVFADEDTHTALVVVDDSQLSLAIGKDGQNVRLAAKLTGYKIDIKNQNQYQEVLDSVDEVLFSQTEDTEAVTEDAAEEQMLAAED